MYSSHLTDFALLILLVSSLFQLDVQ